MGKPIEFKESNSVQLGYDDEDKDFVVKDLPSFRNDIEVISCWKMSLKERLLILLTGKLWARIVTYKQPMQSIEITGIYPFIKEAKYTQEKAQ